jgi:hypothetical protein
MASERRALLVSKTWLQAVVLVVLFGFFVLGLLAYRTYEAKPPIPERVVDPGGAVLYTERDVERGQEVFLNNGLMEYGSVFGHGAYLGTITVPRTTPRSPRGRTSYSCSVPLTTSFSIMPPSGSTR